MPSGLPILTFHAIDDGAPPLAFPADRFATGLAALAAAGWRSVPLLELVAALAGTAPLPAKTFAITFDDGYRSVYDAALPVLAGLGLPATLFVSPGATPPGAAGRLSPMAGRERLTWRELRELADHGVEIGSHTVDHPDLTLLDTAAIERELRRSRELLEQGLSRPVRCFAYPFGRFDRRSRDAAAALYDAAFSDRLGLARRSDDRWALPRVETFYLRGTPSLAAVADRRFAGYLALRNLPRRLRRWLRRG